MNSPATTAPASLSWQRFPATVGCFEHADTRATVDALVRWVEASYRDELRARPSLHVYVQTLPPAIVAQIDQLRGSAVIRDAILAPFGPSSDVRPMAHTDELYISHYNKDQGGDQGLFDKHYDGNLGFLKAVSVVRALIYLQSDASYTVVFSDSGVRKAFGTYEFGLLDFHRELHWVEGTYVPGAPQRILLKCNYLVTPRNAGWVVRPALAANTAVFYVVKAAMEYSKSPVTPPQVLVGWICNAVRRLNNVHAALPIVVVAVMCVALGWSVQALW